MEKSKICKNCFIEKPISEFHVAQKPGKIGSDGYIRKTVCYKSSCKECLRKKQKEKYHNLTLDQQKKLRENNSCNNSDYRKKYKLKTNYGLTIEEFSDMIKYQNNKCKICECEMNSPQIDHNHATNEVRALLCRNCNTSLGLLKEDTKVLYNMISYINDYL
jgi:NAD+--asparagine ADP-ribosyltransferase